MAWVNIATDYDWGSSPHIYVTTDYEQYRDGATMYYRCKSSARITGTYGYAITAALHLDGNVAVDSAGNIQSVVLKNTTPNTGTFTWTSSWCAVTKTTGKTTIAVMYVGQGDPWRYYTPTVDVVVEPAGSVMGTVSAFNFEDVFSVPVTKYSDSFVDTLAIKIGDTTLKTISNYTNNSNVHMTNSELLAAYEAVGSANNSSEISLVLTTKSGETTVGTDSKTTTGTIAGTGYVKSSGLGIRAIPWVNVGGTWKRAICHVKHTDWKRGM